MRRSQAGSSPRWRTGPHRHAVAIRPDDADARFSLARVHLRNGDVSAATEQYNALKEINKEKADELQQLINESTRAK